MNKALNTLDVLAGLAMAMFGAGLLVLLFAAAIRHDCAHNPPLPSKAFGQPVPIEAICAMVRQ